MKPVKHEFTYKVGYFFLDLDHLAETFRVPWLFSYNSPGVFSFWRKNYLGDPKTELKASVQAEILAQSGQSVNGPIRLLTNVSFLGYCFNPVSFYYCYAADGTTLEYVVAEVTNTPWGERRRHVLPFAGDTKKIYTLTKDFHVSPFMPMGIDYTWVFHAPHEEQYVLMQNRFTGEKELMFDATLKMRRQALTLQNVLLLFCQFPLMSFKPILAIYWQALKLWLKKAPFHNHPHKVTPP